MMPSNNWAKCQLGYIPRSKNGETKVVHLKRSKGQVIQDYDIYIGGRVYMGGWKLPHSKWANPFKLKNYGNNRNLLLKKYKKYILSRYDLLESLHELKGKR